jgi:hypothetical protein
MAITTRTAVVLERASQEFVASATNESRPGSSNGRII